MKLQVYCIHDSAADTYQTPYFARARGEALRIFTDLANDPGHPVGAHPDDYTLFYIGQYEQGTAEMIPTVPESCGNALEFKTRPTQSDPVSSP